MKAGNEMEKCIRLTGHDLTIEDVLAVAREKARVEISEDASERITASNRIVSDIAASGVPTYGISTGFGEMSKVYINQEQNKALQRNLIISHACAVGNPFPDEVVRAIMLLRLNTHCSGYSGVSPEVPLILKEMLNKDVIPYVPEKGSLGASGDLANLAQIACVMIGEGEVIENGKRVPARDALKAKGIDPVVLKGKDGLGIINGTPVMAALGCLALHDAERCLQAANMGASLVFEAFRGIRAALDPRIQEIRHHEGQQEVAAFILKMLEGSSSVDTREGDVQDPYTLRCVPQVHGASFDALSYCRSVLEREINAVTDNPIVFPDTHEIISGGNFHGQPLALTLDFLAIATAELANISERRIERLVNPALSGNLPAFLVKDGGVNNGYMIPQYTAACLVSENKVLAHPASVDSIPSSANKEDHVSMGAIAARKAREVVWNTRQVLAIEWLVAAQACELRGVEKYGRGTASMMEMIRKAVPHYNEDRLMYADLEMMYQLLSDESTYESILSALSV